MKPKTYRTRAEQLTAQALKSDPQYLSLALHAIRYNRYLDDAARQLMQELPKKFSNGIAPSFTAVRRALSELK